MRTIGWTLLCACAAGCSAPRPVAAPPADGRGEGALSVASPEATLEEPPSTSDSDDPWETFGELPGDTQPGPKVLNGKPVVDGPLIVEIVSRIGKAHTEEIRHCYRKALEDHPGFGGQLTTEFLVGGDGYVKSAKVVSAEFAELGVAHCAVTAIEKWRFPKPSANGDVEATVTYPFNFVPE